MEWKKESKSLMDELLSPIPTFVRIMVKKGIVKKIEEVAKNENEPTVTEEHVVHGYILAAPKGSLPRLLKLLEAKKIDYSKYQQIIDQK